MYSVSVKSIHDRGQFKNWLLWSFCNLLTVPCLTLLLMTRAQSPLQCTWAERGCSMQMRLSCDPEVLIGPRTHVDFSYCRELNISYCSFVDDLLLHYLSQHIVSCGDGHSIQTNAAGDAEHSGLTHNPEVGLWTPNLSKSITGDSSWTERLEMVTNLLRACP